MSACVIASNVVCSEGLSARKRSSGVRFSPSLTFMRASVGVEDPLPFGVELDVAVPDRPHDDARIDQRTTGPLAIDADDAKSIRLAAQIHADGHARSDALRRDARQHVAAGGRVGGCRPGSAGPGRSIPARADGLPALLS